MIPLKELVLNYGARERAGPPGGGRTVGLLLVLAHVRAPESFHSENFSNTTLF